MSRKPEGDHEDDARPGEGFVARWARLKRQETDADGQPAVAAPRVAEPGQDADDKDLASVDDQADLPLPSVEDLQPDSDITAFLHKRVPEELRRLAMRRMWTLDPAIRDFIEMAENQYDWNDPNGVPGFGPLPAGTDMEALLAQATGRWKPAEKDPQPDDQQTAGAEDATDAVADASGERDVTDGDQNDADQTDIDQYSPGATGVGGIAEPAEPEQSMSVAASNSGGSDNVMTTIFAVADGPAPSPDDVAPPPRRRHGGALPV